MKYLIFLNLVFFTGCIPGTKDLGGGYILGYGTNTFDRVIQVYNPKGGINITFYKGSNKFEKFIKNDNSIVSSYVNMAVSDDKFILIDRKPIDSICECNEKCKLVKFPDNNKSYELCENAIKDAKFHWFYIIDKSNNTLLGPMAKSAFNDKIIQLHISTSLKFDN